MKQLLNRFLKTDPKMKPGQTYSQCGEDVIIDYAITRKFKIASPTYLDIGAHHPKWLSNTYRFYQRGCCGVCVEPDKELCDRFKAVRKRDTCINAGVSIDGRASADIYLMHPPTCSTFSKVAADKFARMEGFKIREVRRLPMLTINQIIEQYFDRCPNIISIDTEGFDYPILKTFDFSRYSPEMFCVETLSMGDDRIERKTDQVRHFLEANGYSVYADTYINTIFISDAAWGKLAA